MRVSYHTKEYTSLYVHAYYSKPYLYTYTATTGSPTHDTGTPTQQDTQRQPVPTQTELIQRIQEILKIPVISIPDKLLFKFHRSKEAAAHNAEVLKGFNYNISTALEAHKDTQLYYGSEFRAPQELEKIFHLHPNWPKLKEILCQGASFPLQPIPDSSRKEDLDFHKNRGNHKSASKLKHILDKIITEDIERGFALPLPVESLNSIPNASLAPLGCQEQETINEKGEKIPKYRMTHDQSFKGPSNTSVNLRVINDELPPCMYSYVFKRTLHYIVDLRLRHPHTPIYISKFDLDAAYRRCHLAANTSTECLTIYDNMLLMALRLTFGGSPCPSLWGYISDTLADLSNAIIQNEDWDQTSLRDSISDSLPIPTQPKPLGQFKQAKELSVKIPPNDKGKADIYIDDCIAVTPGLSNNCERINAAIPLAIRTMFRPLDAQDPIPRKDIIAMKKFIAEGKLEETKTVLGWIINSRELTVSLPLDKHKKWTDELNSILTQRRVHQKQLHTSLGRLEHIANIIPILRHFFGQITPSTSSSNKT